MRWLKRDGKQNMHSLTNSWAGYAGIIGFLLAYMLVIFEEKIHLKKSKPVLLMGCLMWFFIGLYESMNGGSHAHEYIKDLIAEIGELFFFLLVAMTFINALEERHVFKSLRSWLIRCGMGFRKLYWATGAIAFVLSPLTDNMTTALLMATVALAVSDGNRRFVVPAFINIVVAANAGGAWSPFGDITTLMVWVGGKVQTQDFSYLMLPALVNWLVPALFMYYFVPKGYPQASDEVIVLKPGARFIVFLGVLTVATAVCFHQFLDLPPFLGMMLGLSLLMMKGFYLQKWGERKMRQANGEEIFVHPEHRFDIFRRIAMVEFDTLLFFFGVLVCVGGLQYMGYLFLVSKSLYGNLGFTKSNILIGIISAIVDNIPVMYAVLKMDPSMGIDQWLLITLTAGVGGSLLSIGSAAGVAVMGVDRKNYTFLSHLRWSPVIAMGYMASIGAWWVVTQNLR